ncbi:MAG: cytochrome c peroxidase [Pseudomonadota bacterium]
MRAFFKKKSLDYSAGLPARLLAVACCLALILPASVLTAGTAWGQFAGPNPNAPFSLKQVPVIEPPDLNAFLNGTTPTEIAAARAAAIALGKALLWDVQVGSDGLTACASCHFHAGTDHRTRNTLNPGFNGTFDAAPINSTLTGNEFPFHQRQNPDFQTSKVIQNFDDAVGAQGVRLTQFVDIVPGQAEELGIPIADPVFNLNPALKDPTLNVRQVTRRNTPTYVNSAYSFTVFHDGRANNVFNGANNWGPADSNAAVFAVNAVSGNLEPVPVRMRFAALASQALAPPITDMEMSFRGRTFPKIGKKMLTLRPLAKQVVHGNDSVFGPVNTFYGSIPLGLNIVDSPTGLKNTIAPEENLYVTLIKKAFKAKYWSNATQKITYDATGVPTISQVAADPANTNEFTQMEANFSLFFGLAVQLYESVLNSNDSKFDQYQEGKPVYAFEEVQGLEAFLAMGCGACHGGPEFTAHSQVAIQGLNPLTRNPFAAIGVETQPRFGKTFTDEGIYNISVRPTGDDVGRGGSTLTFDSQRRPALRDRTFPISFTLLALLGAQLPAGLREYVPDLPANPKVVKRSDMVQGAFKVPSLRNVELTGPYFHNGSVGSLLDVVEFYVRGGNFPKTNAKNLHPAIVEIFQLQGNDALKRAIVAFLLTLTDDRVRQEAAPFDHPAIEVPNGQDGAGQDLLLPVPAVGAEGRLPEGLPPLGAFLDINQFQ